MAMGHTLTHGMGIASGLDGSIETVIRLGYSPLTTERGAIIVKTWSRPRLSFAMGSSQRIAAKLRTRTRLNVKMRTPYRRP